MDIYDKTLSKIRAKVINRKIKILIDETMYVDSCYIVNIIVSVLDSKKLDRGMLVNCEHLDKSNSTIIV